MPRLPLLAFLVLLAVGGAVRGAPAAPVGIFGKDDRRVVAEGDRRFDAVGRINRGGGSFCTGVLVAADEVLTAAHCLWSLARHGWVHPDEVHFVAGYRRGDYLAHARGRTLRLPGGDAMDEDGHPRTLPDDWAVVVLDRPIGEVDPMRLATPADRPDLEGGGARLARVGYGADRPYLPILVEGCHPLGLAWAGRVLLHDCDATFGDSGSPVLLKRQNGAFAVLGVQSAIVGHGGMQAGAAVLMQRGIPAGALRAAR